MGEVHVADAVERLQHRRDEEVHLKYNLDSLKM